MGEPTVSSSVPLCPMHKHSQNIQEFMELYNVVEMGEDDDKPRNIQISVVKGGHPMGGPKLQSIKYIQHIETNKVNIGIDENPKMVVIGDYWDDETM